MAAAGADDAFAMRPIPFPVTNAAEQARLRTLNEDGMIEFIQKSNPEDLKCLNFSYSPGSNYDDGTLAHVLIKKDFNEAAKALYKKLGIFRAVDVFFAFTDDLHHNVVLSAS